MLRSIILIAVIASSTYCWWDPGHYLVAQIAKTELETNYPEVFQTANALIQGMNGLADGNDDFVTSSTWADQIKGQLRFLNNWHWYTLPYNPEPIYLQQSASGKYSNIVNSLERAEEALKDEPEKVNFQKAFFIRFALHNVGDIHQPLHSMSLFNETHQDGDMGGNSQKMVTPQGEEMNLHAYWDSGAQFFNPYPRPPWNGYSFPVAQEELDRILNMSQEITKTYNKEYFGSKAIKNLNFLDWAKESRNVGIELTYTAAENSNKITTAYEKLAQEACKQRVALAGYRMANLLKNSFTGSPLDLEGVPEDPKPKELLTEDTPAAPSSGNLLQFGIANIVMVFIMVIMF